MTDTGWADAAELLLGGSVVLIPTDTVYGLAVIPTLPGATQRLFDLKGRGRDVPIAVLVADDDQVRALAAHPVPPKASDLMAQFWPGGLTVVIERDPTWPGDVGDATSIGVRCPDLPALRDLCGRVGPLATTSANLHGEPTPVTAGKAAQSFPGVPVIDGGTLAGAASTVVDCRAVPPRILREGAIAVAALQL